MKITYFRLAGYADIMAGTGKKNFICDLSKSTNRVILLLGPNGSGKTAIVSKLHPFAFTIGDSREGKSIILEGESAYKEIHYQDGDNKYIIKHHINEKGTVKSYFIENGEELNPNGNVTSFKEIIESVMGITEDTFKLMRLGANSSTFIKMNSTQRKAFTSELLSDIDVYSSLYKNINNNFRVLRGLMKNVSTKIESLNLGDLDSARARLQELEDTIERFSTFRDKHLQKLGSINQQLEGLDDVTMFKMESESKLLIEKVALLEVQLESVKGKTVESAMSNLNKMQKIMIDVENDIVKMETHLIGSKDKVNDAMNDIDELTAKLLMVQSTAEVGELSQLLIRLDNEIRNLEDSFKSFKTEARLDDFKRLLDIYKDIDSKILITHSFDHEMIKEIISLELSGKKVDMELNAEYKRKYNDVEQLKAQILATRNRGKLQGQQYIIFKDAACQCACPFEEFFDEITSKDAKEEKDIESDLRIAQHMLDLMDDKFAIYANINLIKMIINANKSTIERLPAGIISIENILEAMHDSKPIYDEEYITRFITVMEDYENLDALREKRLQVKEELSKLRGNSDTISLLNQELIKKQTIVDSERGKQREYEAEIADLNADLEMVKLNVQEAREEVENLSSLSEKIQELKESKERLNEISTAVVKRTELLNEKKDVEQALRGVQTNLAHSIDLKDELVRRVEALVSFQNELKKLEEKYDKTVIIRKSLSSTEGIPLVYIKLYMMDINTYINKLLKTVYGEGLEIGEFIIDEKGFQIPYISNGIHVPDISMVSQGEESFMNLAFSSAFKRRTMGIYNVFIFDELDGPLDANRRESFVTTVDKELDELKAEQAFIISHNNVFENYPIDAILTGPTNTANYSNMKIVHQV